MNKQISPDKLFVANRKIQCAECKEILFSKYQGHFSRCKCEDYIYIDETRHYCRVGGDLSKIIYID